MVLIQCCAVDNTWMKKRKSQDELGGREFLLRKIKAVSVVMGLGQKLKPFWAQCLTLYCN
jgi:hypothetical protein